MIVGVFLNDADDFLSNTAKYNASLGVKVKKTSKLANLSQILMDFGLGNPFKSPTYAWWFFFPIGGHGPAYFPPILVNKKSTFEKMEFFKENCKIQAKCGIKMTRKYPFFTQIAYIAHFWNSVGPIYSTKKLQTKNVA